MRWLINSTNLNGKARMRFRIQRAGSDKWEGLGFWWNLKQFLREARIQLFNILTLKSSDKWGYATVFTQVGEEWLANKADEAVQTTGDYIGWGTGAGTASKSDTALFTEASESRVIATRTKPVSDKIRWVGTLTANANKTITNAGNFTASTGGTLIVHGDFTAIDLNLGDKIEFTIDLEFT
jgi:hypothetical protein